MSYIFTSNMAKLKAMGWYNNYAFSNVRSATFMGTDGTEFTGYFGITGSSTGSSGRPYAGSGYSSSIFGYSPIIYVSSDDTVLSRDDYILPDDVVQVSRSTPEQSTVDSDGVSTVLHAYYANDTDDDITINKILIVGQIAEDSTSNPPSYGQALLFEELLDEPITLAAGGRFARNFEFRLEVD